MGHKRTSGEEGGRTDRAREIGLFRYALIRPVADPHAGRPGGHRLHPTGGNECLLAVPVARASRLRRHSFMGTWAWSCLGSALRSGMVRSLGAPALAVRVNGPRLRGRSNAEWLCGSRWV